MENILSITNLSKRYGDYKALQDVSLDIQKGDVYGLIGRNGAGKTTLMKIITRLINASDGIVELFGETMKDNYSLALSRTASIIETPACYDTMSAYNNLKYYCRLRGIKDESVIDETLEFVGLTHAKHKKAKHYSLGMRQRLGLAIALISNPDFLILDEPINGLDPIAIIEFRDLINRINTNFNTTILISSHILTELYQVSNRFGFINNGEIIKEISKEELDIQCQDGLVIQSKDIEKIAILLDKQGINFSVISHSELKVYDDITASQVNKLIYENGLNLDSIRVETDNLEDYFKSLIKETI